MRVGLVVGNLNLIGQGPYSISHSLSLGLNILLTPPLTRGENLRFCPNIGAVMFLIDSGIAWRVILFGGGDDGTIPALPFCVAKKFKLNAHQPWFGVRWKLTWKPTLWSHTRPNPQWSLCLALSCRAWHVCWRFGPHIWVLTDIGPYMRGGLKHRGTDLLPLRNEILLVLSSVQKGNREPVQRPPTDQRW